MSPNIEPQGICGHIRDLYQTQYGVAVSIKHDTTLHHKELYAAQNQDQPAIRRASCLLLLSLIHI